MNSIVLLNLLITVILIILVIAFWEKLLRFLSGDSKITGSIFLGGLLLIGIFISSNHLPIVEAISGILGLFGIAWIIFIFSIGPLFGLALSLEVTHYVIKTINNKFKSSRGVDEIIEDESEEQEDDSFFNSGNLPRFNASALICPLSSLVYARVR